MKAGIGVFRPIMDERYDLILDLRPRLLRLQCKTAVRRGNVVAIPSYSNRRCAGGFSKKVYTADQVDAVAAYCADVDRCYSCRRRFSTAARGSSFDSSPT